MKLTFKGQMVETNGTPIEEGRTLPSFTVKNAAGKPVASQDIHQRLTMISVVPDIDTRVCSLSTKRFNQKCDDFENVDFYTISTNTIAEQKHWCAAEGVKKMQLLSDADHSFGEAMGLFIPEKGIDARSIWVVDQKGTVVYRELIEELSHEPNYDAVLEFLSRK